MSELAEGSRYPESVGIFQAASSSKRGDQPTAAEETEIFHDEIADLKHQLALTNQELREKLGPEVRRPPVLPTIAPLKVPRSQVWVR